MRAAPTGVSSSIQLCSGWLVAKPNYAFEKRQRELEKKRKKEEKNQRKTTGPSPTREDGSPAPADDGTPPPAP